MRKWGLVALGALLTMAGLVLLSLYFCGIWIGYQSQAWPSVAGQTVSSEVIYLKGSTTGSWCCIAEYVYEVDDVKYSGRSRGTSGLSREEARTMAYIKYAKGSSVNVYYDPSAPRRSVLEPGIRWTGTEWGGYYIILGPICFFWGVGILLFQFLPERRSGSTKVIERCFYHPDSVAVSICFHCGRYICDECATMHEEDEELYCIPCYEKLFPTIG